MLVRALVAGLTMTGCVAYNDPCVPLIDDPNQRVAFIASGTEVFLDRPNARHANNAIGQAAADAFVWVFKDADRPADLGVINGGSIRAEGLCVTRNQLSAGPLMNGVLHEILLFENPITAVDLSEQELTDMFEHSVERLYTSPSAILTPSGIFLHPSGSVSMDVDCTKPVGSRLTALTVKGQAVQRPGRPLTQVKYRVALSSFLVGGGDGYAMLAGKGDDPSRNPVQAPRFGGIDSNITTAYLRQSAFNQTVDQGLRVDPTRVRMSNCSAPPRPSN